LWQDIADTAFCFFGDISAAPLLLQLLCPLSLPLSRLALTACSYARARALCLRAVRTLLQQSFTNLICSCTAVPMPCPALPAVYFAGWDVDGDACDALLALLIKAAAAAASLLKARSTRCCCLAS
jgi:hypothetical protein